MTVIVSIRPLVCIIFNFTSVPASPVSSCTAWVADQYLRTRSPQQGRDLLDLLRAGLIELAGFYTQPVTELPALQELVHSFEFAVRLGRDHGFDVHGAMLNDMGAATWILPDVLSQWGIRYYLAGTGCYHVLLPWADLPPLFHWQGPGGGSVLFWHFGIGVGELHEQTRNIVAPYGLGFLQVLWPLLGWYDPIAREPVYDCVKKEFLGPAWSREQCLAKARESMRVLERRLEVHDYPYDAIMLQMGGDNYGPQPAFCETVADWNEAIGSPRAIIATQSEFFRYMEQKYGDAIPAVKGHISDPWSDRCNAKPRHTALYLRAARRWRHAGIASTMASLTSGQPRPTTDQGPRISWNLLHYSDHTYGLRTQHLARKIHAGCALDDADFDASRGAWQDKARYAEDADSLSRRDFDDALARLCERLPAGAEPSILVVNTGQSTRSDPVDVTLSEEHASLRPYDAEREVFPPTEEYVGDGDRTMLKFLAQDVPGCGYKRYPLREKRDEAVPALTRSDGQGGDGGAARIENRFYRVAVDPRTGCIAGIWDKEVDRDLVDDDCRWPFNEFIHEEIHDLPLDASRAGLVVPRQRTCRVPEPESVSVERGTSALGARLVIRRALAAGPAPTRLTQTVQLCDHAKRIEIINRIVKEPTLKKEALYFAFPFAVDGPGFHCELAGTMCGIGRDLLDGSHTDYHGIQNSVLLTGRDVAILWCTTDAPNVSLGDMRTLMWKGLEYHPARAHIYSFLMHNTWYTDAELWQGGEMTFRYALTSRAEPPAPAGVVAFGRAAAEPLEARLCSPGDAEEAEVAPAASLFGVSGENIVVEAMEPIGPDGRIRIILTERNGESGLRALTFVVPAVRCAHRTDLCGNVRDRCRVRERSRIEFEVKPHELIVLEVDREDGHAGG